MTEFFVSPNGTGDGLSEGNPALYKDAGLWEEKVKDALDNESVIVTFLDGEYTSALPKLTTGHPDHILTLQGNTPKGAVFVVAEDEPPPDCKISCIDLTNLINRPRRIMLEKSENIIIRRLHFTGSGIIGYVVFFNDGCKNILMENCTFENMPGVVYGAIGTRDLNKLGTRNITVRNCRFKAIGCDVHAHMMYNSFFVQNILVQDCYFEECSGDYVRFLHETDHCVVKGCVFKNTGADYSEPRPFISVPVINDCKPGTSIRIEPSPCYPNPPKDLTCPDPLYDPKEYGYFGTHFVFANNQFIYEKFSETEEDRRFALAFIHAGWDPPGRFHLLTEDEGNILCDPSGSLQSKKRLLKQNCGIDMDQVTMYGNSFQGVKYSAAFESYSKYCATSDRWNNSNKWEAAGKTAVDISDLLNPDLVKQPSQWLEPVLSVILSE